jgi:hypothetical protein
MKALEWLNQMQINIQLLILYRWGQEKWKLAKNDSLYAMMLYFDKVVPFKYM